MVLADIVHGEVDWADVMFLLAAIAFFIGAVYAWVRAHGPTEYLLLFIGLVLISVGWLLL